MKVNAKIAKDTRNPSVEALARKSFAMDFTFARLISALACCQVILCCVAPDVARTQSLLLIQIVLK
jgi:hypothetical protein